MTPQVDDWFISSVNSERNYSYIGRVSSIGKEALTVDWFLAADNRTKAMTETGFPVSYDRANFSRLVSIGRFLPYEDSGGVL